MRVLRRGGYLLLLAACAHARPHAHATPTDDDLTLYRDVALVRQHVELDGTSAPIAVPEGVTAEQILVLNERATVRNGAAGQVVVDFARAGRHAIVVGYITDKLRWDASYTLTTSPARDRAVLHGVLAIHNSSGITLRGPAHVIDAELGAWRARQSTQVAAELGEPGAARRELGALVVPPGEMQVALVDGAPRPMHSVLVYDPIGTKYDSASAAPLRDASLGVTEPASPNVSESFEITRDAHETAGLPGGPVRLVERRANGSLAPLAEARLFDAATRRSDIDTIAIGTAEGVTGTRVRRELTDEESRHRLVEEFQIEIRNTRAHPVDVLVREHLYRGQTWALAYWSVDDIRQEGPQAFAMRTRVLARGQVKILYVVVYTWGT
jgi:hypothetical protein